MKNTFIKIATLVLGMSVAAQGMALTLGGTEAGQGYYDAHGLWGTIPTEFTALEDSRLDFGRVWSVARNVEQPETESINAFDDASVRMLGGQVNTIQLRENSSLDLYGGDVQTLIADPSAHVTLNGFNFNFVDNVLSGNWSNGDAFSIVTTFWLSDGSVAAGALPSNISLVTNAPIPASAVLLLSILLPALRWRLKLRKATA